MNRQVAYCFLFFLITPFAMYAETTIIIQRDNYWQCSTSDKTNTEWSAKSAYPKIALNLSYALCKKKSQSPKTCKTSRASCINFINGVNVMPMWRCMALDREALVWRSELYPTRDDAALAAQAFCRQKSPVPETCYINLITCRNINRI